MESLQLIEKYLKKYEYPTIYTNELSDILSATNRKFLLSWLFGLLQDEPSKDTMPEDILSDFLSVYGFCKPSETAAFLRTDLKYPLQLEILNRIFKFLDTLKKNPDNEQPNEVSIEEIQYLGDRDLNIFKSFGPIQLKDESKHKSKVVEDTDKPNELDYLNTVDKISRIEENLQSAIDLIRDILKLKNCKQSDPQIGLEESLRVLREFNSEVTEVKDYIKKVEFLSKYSDKMDTLYMDVRKYENGKITKMVKEIIQLIHVVNDM